MHLFETIVLILLSAGTAAFFARRCGSPAGPAPLLALLLGVQVTLALVFLSGDITGARFGFFWLLAAALAFGAGQIAARGAGAWGRPRGREFLGYALFDSRTSNAFVGILTLLAFIQPVMKIRQMGYRPSDIFSPGTLLDINSAAAFDRYAAQASGGADPGQALLLFVYLAPLVGGFNVVFAARRHSRALCAATLLPSVFVLLTQNTKAVFIGAALLFACAAVTARFAKTGRFFRLTKKRLCLAAGLAAAFLLLNFASFLLRYGSADAQELWTVADKSLNYLLGQMPAFNAWFCGTQTAAPQTWGLQTFGFLPQLLGISDRVPGIYPEKLVTRHLDTNVYTAFRPLIEDFSSPGALLVLFAAGFGVGACFSRLRAGRAGFAEQAVVAAGYFYILYSFITSPFLYVSYTAALALFAVYLLLVRRHTGRGAGEP